MKNITGNIQQAISQDVLWSVESFFTCIEKLKNNDYQVHFSEGEEKWATIIKDGQIIGYMWRKYPVVFILEKYILDISNLLTHYSHLSLIEARRLNDEEFELDYDCLKDFLDYGVNYKSFSAEDLWFYTNSI